MSRKPFILSAVFILAHVALVVGSVPMANIVPAALGASSLSAMTLSLILAARSRAVDWVMDGPDKSYVLHRYLGFIALFTGILHWGLADDEGFQAVFPAFVDFGEESGLYAIWGLIGLTLFAVIRAIPYHLWKLTHMLMGPIYLFAIMHSFFVESPLTVGSVPWVAILILSAFGLVGWGMTLARKRSPSKRVIVSELEHFEGGVDITLTSEAPLPEFKPGQFVTIARDRARSEPHPFSIAGGGDCHRRFLIRNAGDWTERLAREVKEGDAFRVSKAVGRFLPNIAEERCAQIWIAGGVGVTPFMAAIERMQPDQGQPIMFILCVNGPGSLSGVEQLEQRAVELPQLDMKVVDARAGNRLTSENLTPLIEHLPRNADLYLCGPDKLKELAVTTWRGAGFTGKLHSEKFDFRGAYSVDELMYLGKPLQKLAKGAAQLAASTGPIWWGKVKGMVGRS